MVHNNIVYTVPMCIQTNIVFSLIQKTETLEGEWTGTCYEHLVPGSEPTCVAGYYYSYSVRYYWSDGKFYLDWKYGESTHTVNDKTVTLAAGEAQGVECTVTNGIISCGTIGCL